jgi:hypothetical protein
MASGVLTGRGVLVVCVLLCCALPGRLSAGSRLAAYDSQAAVPADIDRLAARLQDAPEALRSDFALAVLAELILVYQQEAERARAEVRHGAADRDLLRWSRAVEGMVADLQRLVDQLSPETPVLVSTLYADTVYLIVDGNPVLLTGPRGGENAALERRVVQRFCSRNDCSELIDEEPAVKPAPVTTEEPPLWRFGDAAGPVCASGDGLELQFQNAFALQAKREACSRIVAELNTLASALNQKIAGGTPVDWSRLKIRPASGADVQRVDVNADGDYLLMSLPTLEASPELFRLVLPWLAAKVDGKHYTLVVLNTERLLMLPVSPVE